MARSTSVSSLIYSRTSFSTFDFTLYALFDDNNDTRYTTIAEIQKIFQIRQESFFQLYTRISNEIDINVIGTRFDISREILLNSLNPSMYRSFSNFSTSYILRHLRIRVKFTTFYANGMRKKSKVEENIVIIVVVIIIIV